MLFDEASRLPDSLIDRLEPVRVQEYLRAAGWSRTKTPGDTNAVLYQRPGSWREQVLIPTSADLLDFVPRMAEALAYVAKFENRSGEELLAELLLPESDILRFQESGPVAAAGDLPFDHAISLISGMRKAMLASACSVLKPVKVHRRMSFGDAEQFLQKCRLGQTERGSFILMVACPLNAVPSDPDLFATPPFTRQVTTLLMRSIHRLIEAIESGDSDSLLNDEPGDEQHPVLSANLCEGLLEMQPEGDRSFLRISANYSNSSSAGNAPQSVRLSREIFPRIESLIGKLKPVEEPRHEALVGYVETLNGRPNSHGMMEGQIALRLMSSDIENLKARIELDAGDYQIADKAHMTNSPVSLDAILRQAGRTYKLDAPSNFRILPKD